MKKIVFGIIALAVCVGFSAAEGYWTANNLDAQSVTKKVSLDKDCYLIGTSDKAMTVDKCKPVEAPDGGVFNRCFNTKSSGNADLRSVHVKAKKGETLSVYTSSASGSETRKAKVVSVSDGSTIVEFAAPAQKVAIGTVRIPADGEYYITSTSGGICIYAISLE